MKFFGRYLFVLCNIIPLSFYAQAEVIYPKADWERASPADQGVNLEGLKTFEKYAFTETPLLRTNSVVIIHKGKIIFERYANGFNSEMPHLSWSIAKSFTAVVLGIAQDQNLIRSDETLADFYGDLAVSTEHFQKMRSVTLFDEIAMASGRQWVEDYTTLGAVDAEVVKMLYLEGSGDMAAYAASLPLINKPADSFLYDSGNSNVVMGAIKRRLRSEYLSFSKKNLFDRIGMNGVTWERDQSGTMIGGTYLYATARDYARFGYLLLNEGRWNQEQVVSKEWLDRCKSLSPALESGSGSPDKLVRNHRTYGAGFWLNIPAPKFAIPKPFADVPSDAFAALGHEGQAIFVIPSLDLVVVRNAHDDASAIEADSRMDWNRFLKPLVQAMPNYKADHAIPPPPPLAPVTKTSFGKKVKAVVRAFDF
ncbi:MAG: serine hydrolase domain-containing protein, partial [Pseudobdellovibrionaceae bacterium]